ncbi:MAG: hypothetical protein O3A14_00720 [Cyanobacteria bacterium]|nr:hypothetical protein [Cyanobacteriota bacterium]
MTEIDALKLELQNQAISRAALGMSTTAQVAAVASALCWPVGLWVGGWFGVAALASAAALIMGGTVAAIDQEIRDIEQGNKAKLKLWLTADDLSAAAERHGLEGVPENPKLTGSSQTPSPSTATRTAPTAPSEAAAGLTRGELKLRPETHLKLLAPSRGGKTNTLLHLLKEAKRVTYITLKDSDRVPQHWQGYRLRPFNIHRDVAAVLAEVQRTVGAILEGTDKGEHWLVIDEALAITDLLQASAEDDDDRRIVKEFSSLIKLHLATGAAQGARLALMSQTQNGSDIKGISAASLQNLWTVICGSERCADGLGHMAGWYQKHVGGLGPEQVAALRALTSGFYQLASVKGGPVLCDFPQFTGDLKPCGVPGHLGLTPEPATGECAKEGPEVAIIDHLKKAGEAKTAPRLRADVWCLKSMAPEYVEALLEQLVEQGKLRKESGDRATRYLAS